MPSAYRSSGDLLADRRFEYAGALAARGDLSAAAEIYAEALKLAPRWVAAWRALGETRLALGDRDGAAEAFRRCLALDPADETGATLHLARIEGGASPAAAPRAYVTALFDAYAPEFDAALVSALGYRGHALVAEAAAGRRYQRALDIGCGSGLAGPLLRPLVDYLEGVDLAPQMIEAARRRGVYDRLSVSSFEERLAGARAEFDLIIAADVFCYVGDLAPAFAAIAAALEPGGRTAFTLERSRSAKIDLQPSLRFAHSEDYARGLAAQAGLAVERMAPERLRYEAGVPIECLCVVLSRSRHVEGPLAKTGH